MTDEFQGDAELNKKLGADGFTTSQFRGDIHLRIPSSRVRAALQCLKEASGYDMLIDVTCVDYLEYSDATDRFGVIYSLLDTKTGARLFVKTMLNEPELSIPTVVPLWRSADWLEREVYDMFGIIFTGHPDLRRILMPEEFTAFPLRKDYPLRGRGERHNFPVITRAES